MKKALIWTFYRVRNFARKVFNVLMKKLKIKYAILPKYKDRKILDRDEASLLIKKIITDGKPALVARFGSNEALCTADTVGIKLGAKKKFGKKILYRMHNNAGVFPYGEKMAYRFGEISIEAAKQVDLLGRWKSNMQDYLIRHVCRPDMQLTSLDCLEPYYGGEPWTAALKGKKVLVIHPFKETIESQYKKRELLFKHPDMLPEFDLKVLKAVQTIAGEKDERFEDWEEALEYMHEEAMKIDFDVAIIGCGAYGMALAAKIKQSGKIAIHLGGATQVLFGIKGARWEGQFISTLYNEHWVRPSESETPKSAKKVEGACYW